MENADIKKQIKQLYLTDQLSREALRGLKAIYLDICGEELDVSDFVNAEKEENKDLVFYGPKDTYLQKVRENKPLITVIIPTHNRAQMLCKCVDSVLMQDYENIEILIIDDCSTDNTTEIIADRYKEEHRVRYFRNDKNLGMSGSRLKVYNMSNGEYTVFLDDDDYYFEPAFFSEAVALFYEYPSLSMVCANSVKYDIVKKTLLFAPVSFCGVMKGGRFFMGFRTKYRKPNSTFPVVFRKAALDKADFSHMRMMNDTSIYLRASLVGDVCMIRDWVGVYLMHAANHSKTVPLDFILQNLDEKINIYHLAKGQMQGDLDGWLYDQLMDTIRFYLRSKPIELPKMLSLLLWIRKNGGSIKERLTKETMNCYDTSTVKTSRIAEKLAGGVRCFRDHGAGYTFRRALFHIGLWKDEEEE